MYARSRSWCSSARSGAAFSTAVSASMAVAKSPLSILLCAAATRSSVCGSGGARRRFDRAAASLPEPAGAASPCDETDITTSRRSRHAERRSRDGHAARRHPRGRRLERLIERRPDERREPPARARDHRGLSRSSSDSARAPAFAGDGVKRTEARHPALPRDMGCSGSAMRPVAASWWPAMSSASTRSFDVGEARRGLLREELRDDGVDLGRHVRARARGRPSSGSAP